MNKKTLDRDYLHSLQPPVPDPFKDEALGMIHALAAQEEQIPMKRKSFTAILITALLMIALASAALAIAGGPGVLDFLFGDRPFPKAAEEHLQTVFTQSGGELDDIRLTVRDAVSDGRSLFLSVEAKATQPGDALLLTPEGFDPANAEAMAAWQGSYGAKMQAPPDWSAIGDKRVHYLFPLEQIVITGTDGREQHPATGLYWHYEGIDTAVTTIIIDLTTLADAGEQLTVALTPVAAEKDPAGALPEYAASSYVPYREIERTALTVEVSAGSMQMRHAAAAQPIDYTDMHIEALDAYASPLATYITVQQRLLKLPPERTVGYQLLDADGQPFEDLIMVRVMAPGYVGGSDLPVMTYLLRADVGLPERVTLRAMPFVNHEETGDLPEDLVVELAEV